MKFLQFLVVFFAIFFLVRLIFRALLPGILRMFMKKMGVRYSQQYQQAQGSDRRERPREGDIRVEYVPPQKRNPLTPSQKAGEFVEFEEVKQRKE